VRYHLGKRDAKDSTCKEPPQLAQFALPIPRPKLGGRGLSHSQTAGPRAHRPSPIAHRPSPIGRRTL